MEQIDGDQYKFKLVPNDTNFGLDSNASYWVMGAIFLHNYYSIYDYSTMNLGLIEAKQMQQ